MATPPEDDPLGPTVTLRSPAEGVAPAELLSGNLGDRYRIVRFLGAGGMGMVYLAVDLRLGQEVALKVVAPRLRDDPAVLARVRDEVALAHKVTHHNVCRTHDLEEVDGRSIVKMELVVGRTLAERIAEGPLPLDEALAVARQVLQGLDSAHARGVVHCDLKPQNIMLESATGRVVLMDFGIAQAARSSSHAPGGTPAYMAPELWEGGIIEPRADLYALGCVLYEMLTGERPFRATTPSEWADSHRRTPAPPLGARRRDVPRRVARLVDALLAKSPEARPASATEVLRRLRPPRRWRYLAAGAAVLAALAGVVLSRPRAAWQPEIHGVGAPYEENGDTIAVSPDGKWLAYVADRDGSFRVWLEPADGGESRPLTDKGRMSLYPSWSGDGRALYISDVERLRGGGSSIIAKVWRVAVADGARELIADEGIAAVECGGGILIHLRAHGSLPDRLVLRRGGDERELVRPPGGGSWLGNPRCSRDGRFVVWTVADSESARLWMAPMDGGAPRQLTDNALSYSPSFAPDGKSIVYSVVQPDGGAAIWELPLPSGKPRRIVGGDDPTTYPVISPDGARLYYVSDVSSAPLEALTLADGSIRRVQTRLQSAWPLEVSPDGKTLALMVADSIHLSGRHVALLDLATERQRDIGSGAVAAFAPDGTLVFGRAAAGRWELLSAPASGGPARIVTTIAEPVVRLAIDDAAVVHFATRHGRAWVVPLAGGTATLEGPPAVEWVATAPRTGLRAVLTEGKIVVLPPGADFDLTRSIGAPVRTDSARWSPDGRSLYFWDNEGIGVRGPDGADRRLVRQTMVTNVVPSRDGATVYFSHVVAHSRRLVVTNFAARPR